MIPADLTYVSALIKDGLVHGPVLELGTGYDGDTCRAMVTQAGLDYFGTDMMAGKNVDYVIDFEKVDELSTVGTRQFGTILILNVLEHTFDPIRVLDNARRLLKPGGALVVLTPTVWALHNFPMDTWRIMPNFYEEYCRRNDLELVTSTLQFVGHGPVGAFRQPDGTYGYPLPTKSRLRYLYGKVIHRIFNTYGRNAYHPTHVATAALMRRRLPSDL